MNHQTYSIFLDDERSVARIYPKNTKQFIKKMNLITCRSYKEAVALVEKQKKMPTYISFDNDLGQDWKGNVLKEGKDFAEWLIEADLDKKFTFDPTFSFFVHSANVIQSKEIEIKLTNYLRFKYPEWTNSEVF